MADDTTNQTQVVAAVEPAKATLTEPEGAVGAKDAQTTPVEPTISKTEHEKLLKSLKDGHAGTVAQMRKDRETLQAKLEEFEDKMEENSYENWLRVLEEKGIENLDLAKQVVERDKTSRKALREFEREKTRIESLKAELDQAGKGKAAYDLAKEYQLDEAVVPQLLAAENDWAMRAKAQELYIEKLKGAAQPPENPDPTIPSSKGVDLSKMGDTEKMGWAIQQFEQSRK